VAVALTAHLQMPTMEPPDKEATVTAFETLLQEARGLDLARTDDRFRLGELAEAMRRDHPAGDLFERLAIDLETDPGEVTEAWYVATAFPPATRRPGLPWQIYLILRYHPDRHELVSLAARHSWDQARVERELADRFATQLGRAAG
jgi:hypothetical protein